MKEGTDNPKPMPPIRWHLRLDPDPLMLPHARWELRATAHGATKWRWINSFPTRADAWSFLDRIREMWMSG